MSTIHPARFGEITVTITDLAGLVAALGSWGRRKGPLGAAATSMEKKREV